MPAATLSRAFMPQTLMQRPGREGCCAAEAAGPPAESLSRASAEYKWGARALSPRALACCRATPLRDARMQSLLALRRASFTDSLHPLAVPRRRRVPRLASKLRPGGRGCAGPQRRAPLPLQGSPARRLALRTRPCVGPIWRSVFPAGRTRQDGRNTPAAASREVRAGGSLGGPSAGEVTRRLYCGRCR